MLRKVFTKRLFVSLQIVAFAFAHFFFIPSISFSQPAPGSTTSTDCVIPVFVPFGSTVVSNTSTVSEPSAFVPDALIGSFEYAQNGSSGGTGDGGDEGGTNFPIVLQNCGSITSPIGTSFSGILVESYGGNGGDGGSASLFHSSRRGADGGDGGDVNIYNFAKGNITTGTKDHPAGGAHGIYVLSQGGNGGNGGNGHDGRSGSVGGLGGNGGEVFIQNDGSITTYGTDSNGIKVRSQGGEAGNGGGGSSLFGIFDTGSAGDGGAAGNSGTLITMQNSGDITTNGNGSVGIELQSIGGQGGTGGSDASLFVSIGASGGAGGLGGKVSATHADATIHTTGSQSAGLSGLSLGGGGGDAGDAADLGIFFGLAIGGSGGGGGSAEKVDIELGKGGVIRTEGPHSTGIIASSIGGGGGHGGKAEGISVGVYGSAQVSLGGSGGSGGSGAAVSVTTDSESIIHTGGSSNDTPLDPAFNILPGDHSPGIMAQSVGGGGGVGGNAFALSAAASPNVAVAFSFAHGGTGGSGGDGDSVSVNSTGTIVTTGQLSDGIVASSIGGGGGHGGYAISAGLAAGPKVGGTIDLGFGGSGGKGGTGGDVDVVAGGSISTYSSSSNGVLAQSIGGGGGHGGSTTAAGGAFGRKSVAITSGWGGSGGSGNSAGDVTVNALSEGRIATLGHHSHGIVAQSVGGGGGAGGTVHTYAASVSGGKSGKSAAVDLTVGGSGGGGGSAGTVTVNHYGGIYTIGDNSAGILAQSIGGGGGVGGSVSAISAAASIDTTESNNGESQNQEAELSVTVGGSGGAGNLGGVVAVSLEGSSITTNGIRSHGIVAQSIGGGGGHGGAANAYTVSSNIPTNPSKIAQDFKAWGKATAAKEAGLGAEYTAFNTVKGKLTKKKSDPSSLKVDAIVGGAGGVASTGGAVTVSLDGETAVTTTENHSHGLLAQSIGGSGGSGGSSHGDGFTGVGNYSATLSLGGTAASGGDGGTVQVTDGGATFVTQGDFSNGYLLQSIGGGGGEGGTATSKVGSINGVSKAGVQLGIGGKGGSAGAAQTVSGTFAGKIYTTGDLSSAILAQSIGGGGGAGAHSVDDGGITFSIGGSGGGGSTGGDVNITTASSSLLQTQGEASPAIHAQSIGGSGGHGGGSSGLAKKVFVNHLDFSLGGSGFSGSAGDITISQGGKIFTLGNVSPGILAQSIGGGGGSGAIGDASILDSAPIVFNLTGSAGGTAGNVTVADSLEAPLTIATTGAGSHGMVLQTGTIGSGVLLVGDDLGTGAVVNSSALNPAFLFENPLNTGQVTATLHGAIQTAGDHAYGILAASAANTMLLLHEGETQFLTGDTVGGSQIFPGLNTGGVLISLREGSSIKTTGDYAHGIRAYTMSSGTNAVNVDGVIAATGDSVYNIFFQNGTPAQSRSSGETLAIHIGEHGGLINTGKGGGAINVENNIGVTTIKVAGSILAKDQTAITSSGVALVTIDEGAVVKGDILLSDTTGEDLVTNSGSISGALQTEGTYSITGGTHLLSIDPSGLDTKQISAHTLQVQGGSNTIIPQLSTVAFDVISPQDVVSFAQGDVSIENFQYQLPATSYAVSPHYGKNNETFRIEGVSVDYDNAQLGANDSAIAKHANKQREELLSASDSALEDLLTEAANAQSVGGLSSALSKLDASDHYSSAQSAVTSSGNHLSHLQSCGGTGGSFDAISQTECSWGLAEYTYEKRYGGAHRDESQFYSFGKQVELGDGFYGGLGFGYELQDFRSTTASSNGDRFHVGGVLKYIDGPWFGNWVVSGNVGWTDAARSVQSGDKSYIATSDQELWGVSNRFTVGQQFELEALDIIPRIDTDIFVIGDQGYREHGAEDLNLRLHSDVHVLADIAPVVRFSKNFYDDDTPEDEIKYRAYLDTGTRFALNDPDLEVSLVDSALSNQSYKVTSDRDEVVGTVGAGIIMFLDDDLQARVQYDGSFGDDTESHTASLKLAFNF